MRFWLTLVVGVFVARADDGLQAGEKSEGDVAAEDVEGSSTAYEHSITVNEIEALVKRGEYFFLAVISREGPRCAEFIEKIPQINAAIAKVNQTLKVYTMDFGEALSELSTEERIRGVPAVMMFVGNRDAIVFHYQPDPELIAKFAERVIATTVKRIEPPMTMEGFEKSATDASVVFVVEDEDYELDFIMTLARRNLHASFGYVLREADNAENLTDYIYVKRVDRERRSIGRVPQRSLANFVKLETHQPLFRYPQDSDVISSAFEDSVIFYLGKSTEIHGKKTSQSKHAISIRRVKELLLGHVHFFAVANTSECSRCAEFMEKIPEFNKELATVNKTLRMYTVDDLAFNAMYLEKRNPRLPSVALLVAGGDSVPYYYYPFPDLVRSFAEDVLKTTVQKIEPHSTIEEFQKSAKVTVVFVVDDEDKEVDFITTLARRNLKVKFGYVMKGSSIAEGLTDYVYVNIINSEQKSMGHAPVDEIARFVKMRTRIPLYEIPTDTAMLLSAYEDKVILYLDNFDFIIGQMEWLQDLGNALRGEFVVAYSDTVAEIALRDFELLHLSRDERRGVRILVKSTSKVYRMEDNLDVKSLNDSITMETVMAFVNVFRTGKLKPYAMSARLPRDWDKRPMKIIVANNYTEFVSKDTHTVVVLLYYPDHVNAVASMRKVAELFIDTEDVLIARMDMTENDLPEHYAAVENQLPAVRLYEKYTNKEVLMREKITVENIKKFIHDTTKRLEKAAKAKMKKANETTEATKPPVNDKPTTPETWDTKATKHEEL